MIVLMKMDDGETNETWHRTE